MAEYINGDEWIPISMGLPEEKGIYLVTYHPCYWDDVSEELCVGIDTFRGKAKWAKEKYQRIIAWRPLPEPYKEEDKVDTPTNTPTDTPTDLISRQAAIEALGEEPDIALDTEEEWAERDAWARHIRAIKSLPPANTDLSEYIDRLWKIAYERGKSERPKGECGTCRWCSDHCCETDEDFTRCPIEEHYSLPKDGYCHLYKPI